MGCYVNPPGGNKLAWLREHGIPAQPNEYETPPGEDVLMVCHVQNPMFGAAAVCFDRQEFEHFTLPFVDDPRPKQWFWVSKAKLLEVSPLASYLAR
jgi:hypothetical protein